MRRRRRRWGEADNNDHEVDGAKDGVENLVRERWVLEEEEEVEKKKIIKGRKSREEEEEPNQIFTDKFYHKIINIFFSIIICKSLPTNFWQNFQSVDKI